MIVLATSISTLILIFLNNICEIHQQFSANAWIYFYQYNIIYYYDSIHVI